MRRPAAVVVLLGLLAAGGIAAAAGEEPRAATRTLTISNDDGELAGVPLAGGTFAVSYRNSIYGTVAEERYEVQPDGSWRLVQLAADQLAVLEEYYAVPGVPERAPATDRRTWTVSPDPDRPAVFTHLSIAATDRGQRTLHVEGAAPLQLWTLVDDDAPFVALEIKEKQ